MLHLLAVSLLWAFSFGLIKDRLTGLDSAFIAAARLGLSLLVFLPFLRLRGLSPRLALHFMLIGSVQFGLMYLAYNESFRHLQAHEVALFTLTTPIFVTLFADALERTFRARALVAAIVAVIGAAVVVFRKDQLAGTFTGILLVQVSNAAFAVGAVLYRRIRIQQPTLRDRDIFALLYVGAVALTVPAALIRVDFATFQLSTSAAWTLVYLGVIASGLGFFLWNIGATRVNAGTLAVFNNAKIPLAVACSLLVFRERTTAPAQLAVSLVLLLVAVWLAEKRSPARET